MLRKTLIGFSVVACLCFAFVNITTAEDQGNGPEKMILKTTQVKKFKKSLPDFPHRAHQEFVKNDCGKCHHGIDKDKKQTPYVKGMKIEKCEKCHFKGSGMPSKKDKKKKIVKLDTFKDAAHANCKTCHKIQKKKNPKLKKKWKKCLPCHVKKKKK